jgi:stage V sporulation protein R
MYLNTFVDQDLVNRHRLFVVGKRLNEERMTWEYFVKSRKVEDYREMLLEMLYHPPHISIDREKGDGQALYLVHRFEEKPLIQEFIANTMLGIEFLWGDKVQLETSEVVPGQAPEREPGEKQQLSWRRVLYTMGNRNLEKTELKKATGDPPETIDQ